MNSVRSPSLPGVVPLFGRQALLFWKVKTAKHKVERINQWRSQNIAAAIPRLQKPVALPSWLDGTWRAAGRLNGSLHTMFSGPSCTADFIFRQDKGFFFLCFLFVYFISGFLLFFSFTASPDLLTGCWVDRHLRFFCARVLMFHLWGEMAAALIIDPLLICSVRWKEKQLLLASVAAEQLLRLRLWSVNTAPTCGGEGTAQQTVRRGTC